MQTLLARSVAFAAASALIMAAVFAVPVFASAGQDGIRIAQQPVGSEESTGPASKRVTTTRQLSNPIGSSDIPAIVGRAIQILTGVSGSIALLMFVWGGVIWLTSGGSPDKVQRGKKIFTWAAIGLVIIFGSYALVNAVLKAIGAS